MNVLSGFVNPTDVDTRFPDEISCLNFLLDVGILKRDVKCLKCGSEMSIRKRKDKIEFRCRQGAVECSSRGIYAGSWFRGSKLKARQNVKIVVCWIQKFSNKQIAALCHVSEKTTVDYRNFLRELCTRMVNEDKTRIGGKDKIVEADETAVHGRKYGRGEQRAPTIWIFGAVDRATRKAFARIVERRDKKTLKDLLLEKVEQGTELHTDEWKGYCGIGEHYNHYSLNHSKQFKKMAKRDDGTDVAICTNLIENMWRNMKRPLTQGSGTTDEMLPGYIDEFITRQNNQGNFAQIMWQCLIDYRH